MTPAPAKSTVAFADVLQDSIQSVNELQLEAGKQIDRMVAGESGSLHEVMIAVEKARTSFDLLMEIRNKMIDTYRELSRMQV
jgi:flagellar hook-basal body complex protein FliE